MLPSVKLPVGGISIPHKLGFSEISPPQSLLPSNPQILNLMLVNLLVIVFYYVCISLCVAKINKKIKITAGREAKNPFPLARQ